jgi:hypothetical protein
VNQECQQEAGLVLDVDWRRIKKRGGRLGWSGEIENCKMKIENRKLKSEERQTASTRLFQFAICNLRS